MTNSTTPTPTYATAIARCRMHYERHVYKRGKFKGDAPADKAKRWKDHFRLIDRGTAGFAVIFHNTFILRISLDGTVMLDSGGWHASPTTRLAFMDAVSAFTPWHLNMYSQRTGGVSRTVVTLFGGIGGPRQTVNFWDGLTINPDGIIANIDEQPRTMKRIKDKDATREFLTDPDVKAFRAVLPVLHAALGDGPTGDQRLAARQSFYSNHRHLDLWCARPEDWPHIVAHYYRGTPSTTWSAYYAAATNDMTKIVEAR